MQLNHAALMMEPFDGVFIIDDCKHDMPVLWLNGAVYYQHISVVNVRASHRIAYYPEEKSRGFVAHQIGIEIEAFFNVFVRR